MSVLLEILGRGMTIDVSALMLQGLKSIRATGSGSYSQLSQVINLIDNNKLDSAQQQLRLYLFENSLCINGRMAAAALCIRQGQIQNAIDELTSVYSRQPNNTMALYAMGHCYERLGKEQEAIEFYQDCLKFKNYLQFPCQRLAAIYLKNGRLEKAIEQYELLKQEYPDDVTSLVLLGYLYIAYRRYGSLPRHSIRQS